MCRAREAARVTEDATLDRFASGGSADAGESESGDADEPESDGREPERGDEDGGSEPDAETGASDRDGAAVEPAVSTYRFAPDGRACADCGGSAGRLWRDGGALVCRDCKQWQA